MPDLSRIVNLLEIVGERKFDDLPCSQCGCTGPIVIVKCIETSDTYDVCYECAIRLGLKW